MPTLGRPCEFTQEVADRICRGLMQGLSLRRICEAEDMPERATVFNWIQRFPTFFDQYRVAREVQAEVMADDMQDIADDGVNDYVEVQRGKGTAIVCDQENINRSRLRVDTRKWIAARLLPKKYGDKVAVEASGKNGGPIMFVPVPIGSKGSTQEAESNE